MYMRCTIRVCKWSQERGKTKRLRGWWILVSLILVDDEGKVGAVPVLFA